MADLALSVRLNADGTGLVGGIRALRDEMQQLRREMGGVRGEFRSTERQAESLSSATDTLRNSFDSLRNVLAFIGVAEIGRQMVSTLTETERLRGALETATGSMDAAAAAFARLESFASQTPFALEQSVQAFIRLKNLGLDPSQAALRSYGNTAAAMGVDLMQFIEAVADATTFEFERLKEFGIRASQEGDRVIFTFQGITAEIQKDAEVIESYLRQIGDVNFGSAMEDQMNRLPGLFSNLVDEVNNLVRAMGDAGLTRVIANTVRNMTALAQLTRSLMETLGLAARSAGDGLAHSMDITARRANDLRSILAQLEASGNGNTAAAKHLREQLGALARETKNNFEKLQDLNRERQQTPELMDAHVKAWKAWQEALVETEKENKKVAQSFEKLRQELEFQTSLVGKSERAIAIMSAARKLDEKSTKEQIKTIKDLAATLFDSEKAIKDQTEAVKQWREEAERARQERVRLRGEVEKTHTAQDQFMEGLRQETELLRLNADEREVQIAQLEAHRRGITDQDEEIRKLIETQQRLRKETDGLRDEAPKVQQSFESLGSRITDLFVDVFDQILRDGKLSFNEIGKSAIAILRGWFSRFAADWLARSLKFNGAGGDTVSSGSGGGGGFGSMFSGFGGGGLNDFGAKLGFSPSDKFATTDFFGGSTFGGTLAAAGAGFSFGQAANSLIGGNTTNSQIGGGIGAIGGGIAGAFFGSPAAGAAIGSFFGSIVGGFFGPPPPNESTAGALNLANQNSYITTSNDKTRQQFDGLLGSVQQFASMVKQATGAVSGLTVAIDVGTRDGVQVDIQGKGPEGPGSQVTFDKDDPDAAFRYIIDEILPSFEGLNEEAKKLITAFDGTTQEILEFASTVLSLTAELPQLQAVFGKQSLETFVVAAREMGGVENFNASVNTFAQRFGFTDEMIEASLGTARKAMDKELTALGTSVETFSTDFAEAIKKPMTGEELKAWVDAGNAIIKVEDLEKRLAQTREASEAAMKSLGETIAGLKTIGEEDNHSLLDQFRDQQREVRDLTLTSDDSADSLNKLNGAMQSLGVIAVEVLQQVRAAKQSIEDTAGGSIEYYQTAGMGNDEKYGYYSRKYHMLPTGYDGLDDPRAINARYQERSALRRQLFDLMPDGEQRRYRADFIKEEQEDRAKADARLDEIGEEVKSGVDDAGDRIVAKFGDAIQPFIDGAARFERAVNKFSASVSNIGGESGPMPAPVSTDNSYAASAFDDSAVGF